MRNGMAVEGKSSFDLWSVGREQQTKEAAQSTTERTIVVLGDHNSGTAGGLFRKIVICEDAERRQRIGGETNRRT